jgi:hypothetical protein
MNPSEFKSSDVPDRPFPGAHSQVPGARSGLERASTSDDAACRSLPLEVLQERSNQGWVVRLPVSRPRPEHLAARQGLPWRNDTKRQTAG